VNASWLGGRRRGRGGCAGHSEVDGRRKNNSGILFTVSRALDCEVCVLR
jgi:hypothetical protein